MAKSKDTKEVLTPGVGEGAEITKQETPKTNVAIVEVNGKEVRKYTLKSHGPEFSQLAEEFASHTEGAEVKHVRLEKGVICPACGHEFHP